MSPLSPAEYAAAYRISLDVYAATLPRSLQAEIGVSSVGHCRSEALYRLQGVDPTNAPTARKALHGTAIHRLHAEARAQLNPQLIIEPELTITMPSGLKIKGHPDEVDPDEPSVTDLKTLDAAGDIEIQRRTGSTEQQRFQRHLYAYGAIQAGLVPEEGLIVRNVWVDRAGQQADPLVEQEPFDMAVVIAADAWITDLLYAAEHNEEVPRDHHYDWCREFCQFFTHCRAGQQHADFIVSDPAMVLAAEMVHVGREEEKIAKSIAEAARETLAPLQQSAENDVAAFEAGDWRIRWQWINTPGKGRPGYWKLGVEKIQASAA